MLSNNIHKIIIICGPTGVGKSTVAVKLAKQFNGEIINADSQQIYKELNIGTAKPSFQERENIPHHLFDIANPDEHFDASVFLQIADKAIEDITQRGKVPFVVGGTGMYIKILLNGISKAPSQDKKIRQELNNEITKNGLKSLHKYLQEIDPESGAKIHANDKTRIIRAIEIFKLTGKPASIYLKEHNFNQKRYNALQIGLNLQKQELYNRIENRIDKMIEHGWIKETKDLIKKYGKDQKSYYAIGYSEIIDYLVNGVSLDQTINQIKINSRRYAKRQLTWFRKDSEINWYTPEELEKIADKIKEFLS